MLLVVEIILTVTAWRRGWRWQALLPMAATLFVSLVAGLAIAAAGGIHDGFPWPLVLLDFGCVTALGVMVKKAPRRRVSNEYVKPVEQGVGMTEEVNLAH